MPCNSVITNTVELSKVGDHDLFERTLQAMLGQGRVRRVGNNFAFSVDGVPVSVVAGRLVSSLPESRLQELSGQIKQAYGKEVVKYAARRFGWVVQFEASDAFAFTATKS
jgi:hypothetical protein